MNVRIIDHQDILILSWPVLIHSLTPLQACQVPLFEWDVYFHFFHLKQEGPSGILHEFHPELIV